MNADKWTHPAFVKNGATTPRNYVPTAWTSEDSQHAYRRSVQRSGETVHDILNKCVAARIKHKLSK